MKNEELRCGFAAIGFFVAAIWLCRGPWGLLPAWHFRFAECYLVCRKKDMFVGDGHRTSREFATGLCEAVRRLRKADHAAGAAERRGRRSLPDMVQPYCIVQRRSATPGASPGAQGSAHKPYGISAMSWCGAAARRVVAPYDAVGFLKFINHIGLFKIQLPCRGQAPGPQASPRPTLVRMNHITL